MLTLLLDDLAERISQQEAQLQALRRELETRQEQLADLNQQKQSLLTKLQQIDNQIAGIAGGSQSVKTIQPKAVPAKPSRIAVIKAPSNGASQKAKAKQTSKAGQPSLPGLIVTLIGEAGRPLTVKELVEAVKRRGFRSRSAHFAKMVETRAYDLKRKGILKRAEGQPGFVLAKGAASKKSGSTAPGQPTTGTKLARLGSLREVLSQILSKADKPLKGSELAQRALQAGYQTASKNFADVVWVALGNMPNVVNIPNQGYRLKKAKA